MYIPQFWIQLLYKIAETFARGEALGSMIYVFIYVRDCKLAEYCLYQDWNFRIRLRICEEFRHTYIHVFPRHILLSRAFSINYYHVSQ